MGMVYNGLQSGCTRICIGILGFIEMYEVLQG